MRPARKNGWKMWGGHSLVAQVSTTCCYETTLGFYLNLSLICHVILVTYFKHLEPQRLHLIILNKK